MWGLELALGLCNLLRIARSAPGTGLARRRELDTAPSAGGGGSGSRHCVNLGSCLGAALRLSALLGACNN